jgi:hypothetical protein
LGFAGKAFAHGETARNQGNRKCGLAE